MRHLISIEVTKLFGYLDHSVRIRPDAPTVITGPNGAGKTHLLRLTQSTLTLNLKDLSAIPFETFRLTFQEGVTLEVSKEYSKFDQIELRYTPYRGKRRGVSHTFKEDAFEDFESKIPPYLRRMSTGEWFDTRFGRVLNSRMARQRIGKDPDEIAIQLIPEDKSEIIRILAESNATMIDTKRLDNAPKPSGSNEINIERSGRILDHVRQIQFEINYSKISAVEATQQSDVSFAVRAVRAATTKEYIRYKDLQKRYSELAQLNNSLAKNSLTVDSEVLTLPQDADATTKRIIREFLDDWESRLLPLSPVNDKITTLRNILDAKLGDSGKQTYMLVDDPNRPRAFGSSPATLAFRSIHTGKRIRVTRLSSGEQHLIALFTLLLFGTQSGSLVLIDEPEISLHAAWKHAFLSDISAVAQLLDLQVIVATHSTAIINNRWELEEPLTFATGAHIGRVNDSNEEVDEFDHEE